MSPVTDTPHYKLSAVLEATRLTADTLRAWERRYGLPQPQRTPGGHRLYTRRDIRTLQWLLARQAEGMRISQAVQYWRELEAAGRDPLTIVPESESPLDTIRAAWLSAGLDFDEARAEEVLEAAFAAYPPETVVEQVLRRSLQIVGNMWYRAEISVQQEHFVSELALRRLQRLIASAPPPTRTERLLIGTPAGERHAFPALWLAVALRWRGWPVVYLGVDIPVENLLQVLMLVQPSIAVYAAQMISSASALQATAQQLNRLGIPLGYGGSVFNRFPSLRKRIPAFFLGESLADALEEVESLTPMFPDFPTSEAIDPDLQRTAEELRLHTAWITAQIQERMPYGIGAKDVAYVVNFMHEQACAALRLGDPTLLGDELRWAEGWLQARGANAEMLKTLWCLWKQAVSDSLGAVAAPILMALEV